MIRADLWPEPEVNSGRCGPDVCVGRWVKGCPSSRRTDWLLSMFAHHVSCNPSLWRYGGRSGAQTMTLWNQLVIYEVQGSIEEAVFTYNHFLSTRVIMFEITGYKAFCKYGNQNPWGAFIPRGIKGAPRPPRISSALLLSCGRWWQSVADQLMAVATIAAYSAMGANRVPLRGIPLGGGRGLKCKRFLGRCNLTYSTSRQLGVVKMVA